ncbi:MAG: arsenic metallochaperone ArsD family protein, partial [Deltaproteobacteria bacterium]|nr:arsenic metallochaperone ArsD family protein [Deltaproteobacteria bacterium]
MTANPEKETIKIEIFDPPMCCPGGLCGPTIDPALL